MRNGRLKILIGVGMFVIMIGILLLLFSSPSEGGLSDETKILCPVCQEKEMKSIVYVGMTLGTLLHCQPYYDEEGNYHYEDPNTYTTSYSCSKGHEWSISRGGNKEWSSIIKDTEDEECDVDEFTEDIGEISGSCIGVYSVASNSIEWLYPDFLSMWVEDDKLFVETQDGKWFIEMERKEVGEE